MGAEQAKGFRLSLSDNLNGLPLHRATKAKAQSEQRSKSPEQAREVVRRAKGARVTTGSAPAKRAGGWEGGVTHGGCGWSP